MANALPVNETNNSGYAKKAVGFINAKLAGQPVSIVIYEGTALGAAFEKLPATANKLVLTDITIRKNEKTVKEMSAEDLAAAFL